MMFFKGGGGGGRRRMGWRLKGKILAAQMLLYKAFMYDNVLLAGVSPS